MEKCCICNREITENDAPILTIGAYGTPKYLCPECEGEFETATHGREPWEIGEAMDKIGNKMAENDTVGKVVLTAVNGIFDSARERAEKIKEGSYDFSLDVPTETVEADEEIPEELRESEEDKALDARETERQTKIDKVLNIVTGAIFGVAVAVILYLVIRRFI